MNVFNSIRKVQISPIEISENQPWARVREDGGPGDESDAGEGESEAQQSQQEQEACVHAAGEQMVDYKNIDFGRRRFYLSASY